MVQEDPKQIVRGWESIWGCITIFLYRHYCPLAKNGQGDILVQGKWPFFCPYLQTVTFSCINNIALG